MHVCILFLFCIVRLGFRLKIWPSTRACTGDTTFPISIICDPVPCLVSQNLKCLWDHEVIIYKCYSRFALLRRSEIEYHYFLKKYEAFSFSYLGDVFWVCHTFWLLRHCGENERGIYRKLLWFVCGSCGFVRVCQTFVKSWNRWCDVFPFDSNINSTVANVPLYINIWNIIWNKKLFSIYPASPCYVRGFLSVALKQSFTQMWNVAKANSCCEIWPHLAEDTCNCSYISNSGIPLSR